MKYAPSKKEERKDIYTIDDIYALPEGERAELFDGKIYFMAPPSRHHQAVRLIIIRSCLNIVLQGVREYWIVDYDRNLVTVYNFEKDEMKEYTLLDQVKVGIYDDLEIDFGMLNID